MIKALRHNYILKGLVSSMIFIGFFFLYKAGLVLYREAASKIDKETSKIETSIQKTNLEINQVNKVIKEVEAIHKAYLERIENQKNLTINSTILKEELSNFINILNNYYDNNVFKIILTNVAQNEEYINVADIILNFEFFHNLYHAPEVALELEKTIITNVYNDITNNFSKLINVDKKISNFNTDTKSINLYYIKEQ